VAELITNAFKYAFPEPPRAESNGEGGGSDAFNPEIRVEIQQNRDRVRLIVGDNGGGLPPNLDWRHSGSLGLELVKSWAEHQLRGTLAVSGPPGATFTISFPVQPEGERSLRSMG